MAPHKGFKQAKTEEERRARILENNRRWRKAHPDSGKRYYQKHKDTWNADEREKRLQRKYGLSVAEYDLMFTQQNGVCAICGHPSKKRRLAVDHNHKTQVIRGLLCWTCNRTIMGAIDRLGIDPMKIVEYTRNNHGTCPVRGNKRSFD